MIEQDLGQIIPDITATATIDNTTGTPECNITVEEIEELGKLINKFKFSFLHLKGEKGDKPQKGVDYYTPQEKEQFTTETKALVTGEGSKQVSLINAETAKVIQQVRDIVAGNEANSNALTLSGKTRLEFEKETQGVAGGYNGTFPLTQATLNGIYLLPATGKFYVCTKEYNGTNLTAPNGNFEELSVYKNRDKLENLSKNLENYKSLRVLTIQELKAKNNLKIGDIIEVVGYYEKADGVIHKRIISDINDGSGILLDNGLYANLIKEQSAPLFYETFLDKTRSFIGHRGMPHVAPENTLPSYQRAYDNNITIWETDLDLTSDGIWVLMHDNTVDRTTDGTGSINSLTLEQVKKLNIDISDSIYQGTKVPTFEEWILLAKKLNCLPFAELKRLNATEEEIKTIVDIVKKYNMEEKFAFCSFGNAVLEKVRKYSFKIQLWWISNDITQDTINWCKRVGNAHLYPENNVITKEKVLFANSQGINIATWTVNDSETAQKLFDYGVCLVASDLLSEVY